MIKTAITENVKFLSQGKFCTCVESWPIRYTYKVPEKLVHHFSQRSYTIGWCNHCKLRIK